MPRPPLQALPFLLLQPLGPLDHRRLGVEAEDEVRLLAPAVEVGRQREVRVPAQAQPLDMRRHQRGRPVDPLRRARVAHRVARAVHEVQHLARVGQRDDQRVVAPHPLVGPVHPLLLVAQRRRQRPVHVHVGHRRQQVPAPAPPQPRPHRVDALHQLDHARLSQAPREVARRRRARDHLRAQGVHVRRVVAQALDVPQPRAPAQHVEGDVEHVIRLMVGKVPLQRLHPRVHLPDESQPRGQPPHRPDAPVAHRVDSRPDLVVDPAGSEHRLRPGPRASRPGVPRLHLPPAPGTVPAALFVRNCLHRKGLLVDIRRLPSDCANYNQDKPFRYSLIGPQHPTYLFWA